MALTFNAVTDTVSWGDWTDTDGLTALSFSLWVKPAALVDGRRIISKWGAATPDVVFILQIIGTSGAWGFAVSTGSTGSIFGTQSNTGIISAGTWAHLGAVWWATGNMQLYVNGATTTTNSWIGGTVGSLGSGTQAATYGYTGVADGATMDLAEVGLWSAQLGDNEMSMLYAVSPSRVRPDVLLHYCRCDNASAPVDLAKGRVGSPTSVTVADHVRVAPPWPGLAGWRGAMTAAAGGVVVPVMDHHYRLARAS